MKILMHRIVHEMLLTGQLGGHRQHIWLRQANWDDILRFAHWTIQHQNGDVIVETDPRESRMRTDFGYFECNRSRWLAIGRQINVTETHGELTGGKSETAKCAKLANKFNDNSLHDLSVICSRFLSGVARAMRRGQHIFRTDQ